MRHMKVITFLATSQKLSSCIMESYYHLFNFIPSKILIHHLQLVRWENVFLWNSKNFLTWNVFLINFSSLRRNSSILLIVRVFIQTVFQPNFSPKYTFVKSHWSFVKRQRDENKSCSFATLYSKWITLLDDSISHNHFEQTLSAHLTNQLTNCVLCSSYILYKSLWKIQSWNWTYH